MIYLTNEGEAFYPDAAVTGPDVLRCVGEERTAEAHAAGRVRETRGQAGTRSEGDGGPKTRSQDAKEEAAGAENATSLEERKSHALEYLRFCFSDSERQVGEYEAEAALNGVLRLLFEDGKLGGSRDELFELWRHFELIESI